MGSKCFPWTWLAWLPIVALAGACRAEEDVPVEGPVSDTAYVAIMVDLLLLDTESLVRPSPEEREAAMDSARADILAEHGVTAEEVLGFADAWGTEPSRMAQMWEQITHVFDSSRAARLRSRTQAQSESEGKLGADARQAAGRDSDSSQASDTVEQPQRAARSRLDSLLRTRKRALSDQEPDPGPS